MNKQRVIITGGSGLAGKWILKHFVEHNYEVINLDIKVPDEPICRTIITDLTDLGQVHNALSQYAGGHRQEIAGIIHFAAIPQAYTHPNEVCYRNNVMSTYNILEAAANYNISKVVIASSESSYGICFASEFFEPKYLPIDEQHPQLPEDSYGLSKVVNELAAETFNRRTGMQVVSFRLGNILVPERYTEVKERFNNPEDRLRILWSYIDARDVANACRLAIEIDGLGAVALNLAADDISSDKPTQELVSRYLPGVTDIRASLEGRATLLSSEKAKKLLGWQAQYNIMDH